MDMGTITDLDFDLFSFSSTRGYWNYLRYFQITCVELLEL